MPEFMAEYAASGLVACGTRTSFLSGGNKRFETGKTNI